ncbi:hypothetical protein ACOI1H_21495 [Loktanella sp. DJP18]|uniref:hypothetical protein n=1 Tax=Loktanella sp. DJP18 TaxID=3409788 RepID=UPI003BB73F67
MIIAPWRNADPLTAQRIAVPAFVIAVTIAIVMIFASVFSLSGDFSATYAPPEVIFRTHLFVGVAIGTPIAISMDLMRN